MKIIFALVAFLIPIAANASVDMILYSKFRKIVLQKGWKPDTNYGDKSQTGFSEVICGVGADAICSAEFWNTSGRKINISVGWDKRKNSKTNGELITDMNEIK